MDDPLQAALDEANSLMNSLGVDTDDDDDDVVDVALNPNYNNNNNNNDHLHPLHDNFLASSNNSNGNNNNNHASSVTTTTTTAMPNPGMMYSPTVYSQPPSHLQQQPQQQQHFASPTNPHAYGSFPQQQQSLMNNPNNMMTSPTTVLPVIQQPQASPMNNHIQQQQQQQQQPYGATASLDSFKAQTRTFASSLATMAQRGLTQVAQDMNRFSVTPGSDYPNTPTAPTINNNNHHHHNTTPPTSTTTTTFATANNTTATTPAMPELDNDQKKTLVQTHLGDLLPGETILLFVSNLQHVSDSTGFVAPTHQSMWCGVMTYYRFILFGTHPASPPPKPVGWHPAAWPLESTLFHQDVLEIPLTCIDKMEKSMTSAASGTSLVQSNLVLTVTSKENARWIRFSCQNYAETHRVAESMQTYAFPGRRNLGYLFAFECKREQVMNSIVVDEATGQKRVTLPATPKRFEPIAEYTRLIGGEQTHSQWRIWTRCNAQYQICASYPAAVVGPNLDETHQLDIIRQCAAFRSEGRWPCLTWGNPRDTASIWRCAQPKMGLQGNRSSADEYVLSQIMNGTPKALSAGRTACPLTRAQLQVLTGSTSDSWILPEGQLKILDLRPRSAAMANRTAGYGYENTSHYPGSTLQFCNIGNIHSVRDAYQRVSNLSLQTSNDLHWTSAVEDTKWLHMIRLIWAAAWETAYWVHIHRMPVLLHCSHGWDRTSQVAALAQLLLDGEYRTRAGFSKLIEKDFLAFGHPFHTRCAHGEGSSSSTDDDGQVSPVFCQFLDCVYQLVRQYPDCFEFNTRYLYLLSTHVYSCRFGTFLCDTERERELAANVRQRTHSVWDYLDGRDDTRNAQFDSQNWNNNGVLLMPLPLLLRNIGLWTDRHARHGVKPVSRARAHEVEQDVWKRVLSSTAPTTTTTTTNNNNNKTEPTPSFTIDDDDDDDEAG